MKSAPEMRANISALTAKIASLEAQRVERAEWLANEQARLAAQDELVLAALDGLHLDLADEVLFTDAPGGAAAERALSEALAAAKRAVASITTGRTARIAAGVGRDSELERIDGFLARRREELADAEAEYAAAAVEAARAFLAVDTACAATNA